MRRFLITQRGLQRIGLSVRRESQVLLDELSHFLNERVETCAFFVDHWSTAHERHKCPVGILDPHGGSAFATFYHHFDLAVLLFLRLENPAKSANAVNLLGRRFVNCGVVLSG